MLCANEGQSHLIAWLSDSCSCVQYFMQYDIKFQNSKVCNSVIIVSVFFIGSDICKLGKLFLDCVIHIVAKQQCNLFDFGLVSQINSAVVIDKPQFIVQLVLQIYTREFLFAAFETMPLFTLSQLFYNCPRIKCFRVFHTMIIKITLQHKELPLQIKGGQLLCCCCKVSCIFEDKEFQLNHSNK